jgi:EAL domain-containing protein (putative c-di-GMP-specific phosphodiesterase class I)
VRIAVDDFGMAQASLRCLSALAVDSLKIDRSFINHLSHQPQTQAVVATIIGLARAYGLRTVAEGVETIEQLEILETLGCEQSQGYLHSPAVPAEEIELIIATRSSAGAP